MLTTMLAVNTLVFLFLGIVWQKSDFTNLMLKFLFFVLTGANGVLLADALGFIVKV